MGIKKQTAHLKIGEQITHVPGTALPIRIIEKTFFTILY